MSGLPPAIVQAVQSGDLAEVAGAVGTLCSSDADTLFSESKDGVATFALALEVGQLEVAKWLVENGVGLSLCIKYGGMNGLNAMHLAVLGAALSVVQLVFDKGTETRSRRASHREGRNVIVEYDVHGVTSEGWTAVHLATMSPSAAQHQAIRVLAWLVDQQGANVELANYGQTTPLHLAASNGRAQVVQWLLSRGADEDRPDGHGATAVDHAKYAVEAAQAEVSVEGVGGDGGEGELAAPGGGGGAMGEIRRSSLTECAACLDLLTRTREQRQARLAQAAQRRAGGRGRGSTGASPSTTPPPRKASWFRRRGSTRGRRSTDVDSSPSGGGGANSGGVGGGREGGGGVGQGGELRERALTAPASPVHVCDASCAHLGHHYGAMPSSTGSSVSSTPTPVSTVAGKRGKNGKGSSTSPTNLVSSSIEGAAEKKAESAADQSLNTTVPGIGTRSTSPLVRGNSLPGMRGAGGTRTPPPQSVPEPLHRALIKLIMIGDASVGKTFLLHRFMHGMGPGKTLPPTCGVEIASTLATLSNGVTVKVRPVVNGGGRDGRVVVVVVVAMAVIVVVANMAIGGNGGVRGGE